MTTAAQLNPALAGRHRVEREIGQGGMATVYLARDLRHNRDVALKVLRADVAQSVGAERFLREIQLAAKLSHPHILPLFDSGEAKLPVDEALRRHDPQLPIFHGSWDHARFLRAIPEFRDMVAGSKFPPTVVAPSAWSSR